MSPEMMRLQMDFQFRVQSMDLAVKFNAGVAITNDDLVATAQAIEVYLRGPQSNLVKLK